MFLLLIPAAFTIKRLKEEHWYEMPLKVSFAVGIAYLTRLGLGVIISRARPFAALSEVHKLIAFEPAYDSFPSGHATITFALAFMIARVDRDWGAAFLILAVLTALGRVFVGVHYPLDILGGALVGWFAAWIIAKIEGAEWRKVGRAMRVR